MERIAMSQEERDWLDWLKRARDGKMTQREAAERMGVTERWVRKLLRRMKKQGDAVVVHGLRGRASNRKLPAKTQKQALAILREPDWHDFGPTFAAEQLAKHHQIQVGKETLRGWMTEAGMWQPGSRRIQDVHGWRPRRSGFGELVQWDTSDHDWLEGRGPVRYLVRMIDDATSWSWGRFVESDATPFNMAVLWEYLEKNGRMVDVYTDRDSMFTVPRRTGESEQERRKRGSSDATGACFAGTGNRLDSGVLAAGQGLRFILHLLRTVENVLWETPTFGEFDALCFSRRIGSWILIQPVVSIIHRIAAKQAVIPPGDHALGADVQSHRHFFER